ncbi:MAG: hypothetical protein Ct9H90mP8_0470 [Pseudomonadota bacterium]|nr:MAG: hypothetical protein Ct9H90mP8_0470 [Pseudomonadota bacterium]
MIELWDQPVPQIKIEAPIFETNESDASSLERNSVEEVNLKRNPHADPGESYAFGFTLGSQETSPKYEG